MPDSLGSGYIRRLRGFEDPFLPEPLIDLPNTLGTQAAPPDRQARVLESIRQQNRNLSEKESRLASPATPDLWGEESDFRRRPLEIECRWSQKNERFPAARSS